MTDDHFEKEPKHMAVHTPLKPLYHDEEHDDCVFLGEHNMLHVGFRRMLMEIKMEELDALLGLLEEIAGAEELWDDPQTGAVMVKMPVKGLSLLLSRPELVRLQHILQSAQGAFGT